MNRLMPMNELCFYELYWWFFTTFTVPAIVLWIFSRSVSYQFFSFFLRFFQRANVDSQAILFSIFYTLIVFLAFWFFVVSFFFWIDFRLFSDFSFVLVMYLIQLCFWVQFTNKYQYNYTDQFLCLRFRVVDFAFVFLFCFNAMPQGERTLVCVCVIN